MALTITPPAQAAQKQQVMPVKYDTAANNWLLIEQH